MLGKLIKHEFYATGRQMLPLFGATLLLAIFIRVSDLLLGQMEGTLISLVNVLLMVAWVVALIGVLVFAVVLMVRRFWKNFLTDEGYLMFTLPVGVHSLLWSKLIVAALFFVFAFLVDALAIGVVVGAGGLARELVQEVGWLLGQMNAYYMANGVAFALEALALLLVGLLTSCLLFYAPMAIGNSFANHKGLLSVVFYFVIQAVLQTAGTVGLVLLDSDLFADSIAPLLSWLLPIGEDTISATIQLVHLLLIGSLVLSLLVGAALYALTCTMLKRHRNLQ